MFEKFRLQKDKNKNLKTMSAAQVWTGMVNSDTKKKQDGETVRFYCQFFSNLSEKWPYVIIVFQEIVKKKILSKRLI